jgi:hypothetical protein
MHGRMSPYVAAHIVTGLLVELRLCDGESIHCDEALSRVLEQRL